MAAPKVQSIEKILADLDPGYRPARDLVRQQQEALPGRLEATKSGLNAQKDRAFQGITNRANRRGLTFSGIPIQEEANYLSTDFLPALASAEQQNQDQSFSLLGILADLARDARDKALGVRQQQQDRRFTFDENKRQRNFQQRQFDQSQALERELAQLQASTARASRGSGGRSTTPKPPSTKELYGSLNQDIAAAFQSGRAGEQFYTEDYVLPALMQAYPELEPQSIIDNVYRLRQVYLGQ